MKNKDGGACFDSDRYTIMAKYSLSGVQECDFQLETFDLEACMSDKSSFSERLFSQAYPLAKMNVFAVERPADDIVGLGMNPEGCVCLCDFDSPKDVNQVLQIAAEKGAVAFLTVKEPEGLSTLPVFLVTVEAMNRLSRHQPTTVTIHKHCDENSETMNSPSDESIQNVESTSSLAPDAVMDESGAQNASKDATAHSSGDASRPIDLSEDWSTNASDMVEDAMAQEVSTFLLWYRFVLVVYANRMACLISMLSTSCLSGKRA